MNPGRSATCQIDQERENSAVPCNYTAQGTMLQLQGREAPAGARLILGQPRQLEVMDGGGES